jgi:hypothetical protein
MSSLLELPLDILERILLEVLPVRLKLTLWSMASLAELASVCRLFLQIIKDRISFWPLLYERNGEAVNKIVLQRNRNGPLSIVSESNEGDKFFSSIPPQRWASIDFSNGGRLRDTDVIQKSLSQSTPALSKITLTRFRKTEEQDIPLMELGPGAPLDVLHLRAVRFDWTSPRFHTLRILELADVNIAVEEFRTLLENAPRLEDLSISPLRWPNNLTHQHQHAIELVAPIRLHSLYRLYLGRLSESYHTSILPCLEIPKCVTLSLGIISSVHFKPGSGSRIPQAIASVLSHLDPLDIDCVYQPEADGGVTFEEFIEGPTGQSVVGFSGQIWMSKEESRKPVIDFLISSIKPTTVVDLLIRHREGWSEEALTSLGDFVRGLSGLRSVAVEFHVIDLAEYLGSCQVDRQNLGMSSFDLEIVEAVVGDDEDSDYSDSDV